MFSNIFNKVWTVKYPFFIINAPISLWFVPPKATKGKEGVAHDAGWFTVTKGIPAVTVILIANYNFAQRFSSPKHE